CLIEPDRIAVCACCKVNELLKVLSARRWRRVLGELENEIEDLSNVLGEVGNIFVERTVVDGKESDLVVLEWNELREMRRADLVQVFCRPAAANAQDQFDLDKGKLRFNGQDHKERIQDAATGDISGGSQ